MGNNRQPAPTNAPPVAAPNERLRPLKPLTIPNQVVDSRHSFFVDAPFVIGPAKIGSIVQGGPDFELATTAYDIGPGDPARDIEVVYHPRNRGAHTAEVTLMGTWSDGHVERESVSVSASARDITEAPPDAITQTNTKPANAPSSTIGTGVQTPGGTGDELVTRRDASASLRAAKLTSAKVAHLFRDRRDAIDAVSQEASKYVPPEAPRSIWWDIAALALTLGTAGLGGVAGMAIERALLAEEGARAAKFIAKVAEQSLARASNAGAEFLRSGKKSSSNDPSISFFKDQKAALGDAEEEMDISIGDGLADVVAVSPATTVAAAGHAMGAGVDAMRLRATDNQTNATALQYVEYRARTSLGTAKTGGLPNAEITSVMTKAREDGEVLGLIDLYVSASAPNAVLRASVHGISKSLAAHLLTTDLRTAGVPLRIHPVPDGQDSSFVGYGLITRDEAGRIRYQDGKALSFTSKSPILDSDTRRDDPEAQAIRSAERIVNFALSKTLAEWNAPLETDDHSR